MVHPFQGPSIADWMPYGWQLSVALAQARAPAEGQGPRLKYAWFTETGGYTMPLERSDRRVVALMRRLRGSDGRSCWAPCRASAW